MASASFYLSSADSPDCAPCKIEGKENEAKWHCDTCSEYTCDECHGVHSRLRMTKDHVTNILVPEPVHEPDDKRSRSKRGKLDLHGEVSGRRQHSDENQKKRDTNSDRNQKHDLNPHGQVSGRLNTSDGTRTGRIRTGEGKKSATLSTDVTHMSLDATLDTDRSSPGVQSSSRHPTYSAVTLRNQFDAAHEDDDKPCWITGVLLVRDRILLADYNNDKIKVFNKRDLHFIFQTRVAQAFDLTKISGDTIAVTSGLEKYFTLFSLKDEELTEIRRVRTSYVCLGICHHDDLIYVVCREKATGVAEVYVSTCEGEMKRRLEPLSQGQKVLQKPRYITVNHQTGTLYITDLETDAVVGLSLSGNVLFNQKVKQCQTAAGVVVDDQGQLYILGFNSCNVIHRTWKRRWVESIK